MKEFLIKINACQDAIDWADGKEWKEIFETCHRGDWLLWLFNRTNPNDIQLLTLAKGYCANTVRHLMKDEQSILAVDAAIAFGEGKITKEQLHTAAAAANYPADADAATTYAAAAATYAAADVDAANAAAAAAYAADVYAADADAKKQNQLLTANICRKYLPIEKWNIKN